MELLSLGLPADAVRLFLSYTAKPWAIGAGKDQMGWFTPPA
jgi:hypothetical protein